MTVANPQGQSAHVLLFSAKDGPPKIAARNRVAWPVCHAVVAPQTKERTASAISTFPDVIKLADDDPALRAT